MFISYLLLFSFYSERGGISIDRSCSWEGKRKKCKKKEASVARARRGSSGRKVKTKKAHHKLEGGEGFYVAFLCSLTQK